MAWRRRWLQAQRKTTPRRLPEAWVTGQTPASAASWSQVGKRARTSPSSARIWAAQMRPARGKDMTILPSDSSATACSMRPVSFAISLTDGRGWRPGPGPSRPWRRLPPRRHNRWARRAGGRAARRECGVRCRTGSPGRPSGASRRGAWQPLARDSAAGRRARWASRHRRRRRPRRARSHPAGCAGGWPGRPVRPPDRRARGPGRAAP